MAEKLAEILGKLSKAGKLEEAVDVLENVANKKPPESNSTIERFSSIDDLKEHYKKKQSEYRCSNQKGKKSSAPGTSSLSSHSASKQTKFFSLNMAIYKHCGKFRYKMQPPGKVQVPGFCSEDSYSGVISKGAEGLGINAPVQSLSLILSNGLVRNVALSNGKPWTLGGYVDQLGGSQVRGKRTFGICISTEEIDSNDEDNEYPPLPKRRSRDNTLDDINLPGLTNTSCQLTSNDQEGYFSNNDDSYYIIDSDNQTDQPSTSGTDGLIQIECNKCNVLETYYCLMNDDYVYPNVVANGRDGVWRLVNMDYYASEQSVLHELEKEGCDKLPEDDHCILVKLEIGGVVYLKMKDLLSSVSQIKLNDIAFIVKEKVLVCCETIQVLNQKPVMLFVVSPEHGLVNYKWEKRYSSSDVWTQINCSMWTCVIYVDKASFYRCTIGDDKLTFQVVDGKEKNLKKSDNQGICSVPYKDIQFNEIIGRGQFGVVYKGIWKSQTVALKQIPLPSGVGQAEMLETNKEMAALRLLKHPNILLLLGYSFSDKDVVIITNYIDGYDLNTLIFGKNNIFGQISMQKRVQVSSHIANALEFMHTTNPVVIHRDIKPSNVMVTTDLQNVLVCDMGISKIKEVTQTTVTTVHDGPTGTYPYMAPEMFTLSHRGTSVDIYAFGCLMIELFGGTRVWKDLTGPQIMQKVCGSYNSPPEAPVTSHLAPLLRDLCNSCCHLSPKKRPSISIVKKKLNEL